MSGKGLNCINIIFQKKRLVRIDYKNQTAQFKIRSSKGRLFVV